MPRNNKTVMRDRPKSVLQLRRGEDGLRLVGEAPKYHEFPMDFLMREVGNGNASISESMIVLKMRGNKSLKYKILEAPGRYDKEGNLVEDSEDFADTDETRNYFATELVK